MGNAYFESVLKRRLSQNLPQRTQFANQIGIWSSRYEQSNIRNLLLLRSLNRWILRSLAQSRQPRDTRKHNIGNETNWFIKTARLQCFYPSPYLVQFHNVVNNAKQVHRPLRTPQQRPSCQTFGNLVFWRHQNTDLQLFGLLDFLSLGFSGS